ncbi:laccase [Pontibacillus halophilus JSM 076056 = DSM 19796]|uniref:Purine nucleoside phosphorylase n=1 Tax=Pontibacillus halophilus JSM 076056 = DSM 19796 TaxID=1385510 RepID=A0A0A5GPZ6_9BACI|nr:peptidoglycan editing factor PgeF [Pontibacillus halophilus]KGX93250.1 laccase [Pontibacillus halophilus JSM 076056 = DSM 19796]
MIEGFHHTHPAYLEVTKWTYGNEQLVAGMTTRLGGLGEVPFDTFNLAWHVPDVHQTIVDNRHILADLLQFPVHTWVGGEQVHGTRIHRVTRQDLGKGALEQDTAVKEVDGLITNEKDVLLTAFYADCVPLFFYDPVTEWVGIAHAGWKGTVGRMGPKMIDALVEEGSSIENIKVAIGPSIGGDVYEVDDTVIQHILREERTEDVILSASSGKYMLSLQHLHLQQIKKAGILEKNIELSEYCTYQNDHLFFSHRRDQGKTGRMLGFIGLRSEERG